MSTEKVHGTYFGNEHLEMVSYLNHLIKILYNFDIKMSYLQEACRHYLTRRKYILKKANKFQDS